MVGINHVHVVQIYRGGLIGQIHRVLQRQVPDGEGLKFRIAGRDTPLVLVVELAQAGGHFPAAGTGAGDHHQGTLRFHIFVGAQALVADDVGDGGGVARNGKMPEAADAQGSQPLVKGLCRRLPCIAGEDHAAHIQSHGAEGVDEPQHILVVGDAQVTAYFVLFDVRRVDRNDDLHILLQGAEHTDLAVGLKARKHTGGMIVVKELAAEFQIELAAELGDALADLLGLDLQVSLVVKACRHGLLPHSITAPSAWNRGSFSR